jgi:aspartate-semialdehyde dehydrogenase
VQEVPPKKFSKQIAFNVIPHIDVFLDSGETKEEWKMVAETKKILDPKIKVTATCVRVPVFVGHSARRSTSRPRISSTGKRRRTSCAKAPA